MITTMVQQLPALGQSVYLYLKVGSRVRAYLLSTAQGLQWFEETRGTDEGRRWPLFHPDVTAWEDER